MELKKHVKTLNSNINFKRFLIKVKAKNGVDRTLFNSAL